MNLRPSTVIIGLAAGTAMLAMGVASAQTTIADCESGTNENNLNAYWYVYDDANDGGTSVVTNATKLADGTYEWAPTAGEGNPQGTPGYGAKVAYQMGETKPSCGDGCVYGQMVGIGTQLAPDGAVADITGATKITYWAKASAPMTARVEVAIEPVKNNAYHRTEHEFTTSWAQYDIILSEGLGISQPSEWNTVDVAFDPTKVEKVQWQVSMDDANPEQGTIWIDDIVIDTKIAKFNECVSCIQTAGSAASHNGWMLSDMEDAPYNQNGIGYYWYCYNDAEERNVSIPGEEFSEIIGGATIDPAAPTLPTIAIDGNGQGGGNGAYIEFQLGPTYQEGGETIKPFVGIGTKLSDNLGTEFYDAAAYGATGIYFDYKTTGDVDQLRLEVQANQTFPNAGIVHHVVLEGTNGEWKGAAVTWEDLVLPRWEDVAAMPPSAKALKTSELSQIQWAFQGNTAATGTIAIDNVKLLDAAPYTPGAVLPGLRGMHARGISASLRGSVLRIALPDRSESAHARLMQPNGRTVVVRSATGTGVSLPLDGLAGGLYLLEIRTPAGSVTSPFTIAK
jgi:hypothetical protein